jgi:isoquinoline 1-oxidoreductase alpha subunit
LASTLAPLVSRHGGQRGTIAALFTTNTSPSMPLSLNINGASREVQSAPETPLLWVIREEFGLTGTKFGCGIAACGACTVHVDGQATRSCVMPVRVMTGRTITTIEGLPAAAGLPEGELHPLQRAWIEAQVPQCGYCQSGMLMAAAALLKATPHPTDADIDAAMTNICRCGTYPRVRRAIHAAAQAMSSREAA